VNVEPAPGVSKASVTVVESSANDMRADTLAFHNLRLDLSSGQPLCNSAWASSGSVWLDNVEVFGTLANGETMVSQLQPNFAGNIYITSSSIHDLAQSPCSDVLLIQNTQIFNCFNHGSNDPGLMVNSSLDGIAEGSNADHVDGIFWYNPGADENSIVYGVTMTNIAGLCLFAEPGFNIALTDVTATASGVGIGGATQFGKDDQGLVEQHIVIDNLNLTNQRFVFVDDSPTITWSDSIIRNSTVDGFFSANPANEIYNCSLTDGTPIPNRL
jgi:hypothetical protein